MKQNNTIILTSCALLLVSLFSMDLYNPSLPVITHALHASQSIIRNLVIAYLFGAAVSQLFYGPLSDRFGRKPIIVFALCVCIIGNVVSVIATTAWVLLFSRLIVGLGAGGCTVISRVILRDTFHDRHHLTRAFAYFAMASTISPAFAPMIGGFLQTHFPWQSNFIFLNVITLMMLIAILILFTETIQNKLSHLNSKLFLQGYKTVLSNRQFLVYSVMSALTFSITIGYYTINPFIFQNDLGFSPATNGLFYIIYAVGILIGTNVTKACVKKYAPESIVKIAAHFLFGISIVVTTLNLFGLFNVYTVLIPTFFIAVFFGVQAPSLIALGIANFKENTGSASAMQGMIKMLGPAIVLLAFAGVHVSKQLPLSLFFLIVSLLNVSCLALIKK